MSLGLHIPAPAQTLIVLTGVYSILKAAKLNPWVSSHINGWKAAGLNLILTILGLYVVVPPELIYSWTTLVQVIVGVLGSSGIHGMETNIPSTPTQPTTPPSSSAPLPKIAAVALCALMISGTTMGCSTITGTKIAQDIVNYTPALISTVATIDATGSLLDPAAAPIFNAATAAFDAGAALVVADAKAYLANPSASILTNLQSAVVSFQQTVSASILAAAKITDSNSQKLALAAINGVATIINTILGLVQSISSKAELNQMSQESPIKLAMIRPYLDQKSEQSIAAKYGITVDQFFATEQNAGF